MYNKKRRKMLDIDSDKNGKQKYNLLSDRGFNYIHYEFVDMHYLLFNDFSI